MITFILCGRQKIMIKIFDNNKAANSITSLIIAITLITISFSSIGFADSVGPSIKNIDATPDPQRLNEYVNITCDVVDSDGVANVYLQVTDPNNNIQNFSILANNTGNTYYCNQTYSTNGQYQYFIWAMDTNGQSTTSSVHTFSIIRWNVEMKISADGYQDSVIFGEADDATDGSPHDIYDIPDVNAPSNPYVNAWFDDNLNIPYNRLWGDYRNYPNTGTWGKTWNLSIKCNTTAPNLEDTTITITWDEHDINNTEYDNYIQLWNDTQMVANMKTTHEYSFPANFDLTHNFYIKCYKDPFTLSLSTSGTGDGIVEVSPGGPYYYGDVVTVWANASVGSSFTGFSGDLGGSSSPVSLTMDDDKSVEATFLTLETISLNSNWNLISLPFNESTDKSDIIVSYNNNNYTWQEAFDQDILLSFVYGWNRTTEQYIGTNTLNPGYGYWVYSYHGNVELIIPGNYSEDNYITTLKDNWNIMGLPDNETLAKEDLIVQYNGQNYTWSEATSDNNAAGEPLILHYIYDWNNNQYMLSSTFTPGEGYWMYAYYNCTLLKPNL